MAERPTKRERRDLARKAKLEEQRRRARRRRRQRATTLLTVLVIAGVIGGLIYMSGKNARKALDRVNALATEAGCTPVQTYPDELDAGVNHAAPPAKVEYKTNPPTSGNHYGNLDTGIFREPKQDEAWVHNLEHGFLGILYKDTLAKPVVGELERFVDETKTKRFIIPRPQNEEELVFVAWTKAVRCAKPTDPKKVRELAEAIWKADLGSGAPEAGLGEGRPNPVTPAAPAETTTGSPTGTPTETPSS